MSFLPCRSHKYYRQDVVRLASCQFSPSLLLAALVFPSHKYYRQDVVLSNARGQRLQASHYRPCVTTSPDGRLPCVVYLHCELCLLKPCMVARFASPPRPTAACPAASTCIVSLWLLLLLLPPLLLLLLRLGWWWFDSAGTGSMSGAAGLWAAHWQCQALESPNNTAPWSMPDVDCRQQRQPAGR